MYKFADENSLYAAAKTVTELKTPYSLSQKLL